MKIIWLEVAQQQLNAIYEFLAQQSEIAATGIYNGIIDETDKLCIFPEMAAIEPLLKNENYIYRSLVVRRNYKVVYRINAQAEEIIVSSIWDCRRNPKALKFKNITL
jgi:plasmid stabilization system protein ParE